MVDFRKQLRLLPQQVAARPAWQVEIALRQGVGVELIDNHRVVEGV
jgi:hypothetical protein